MFFLEVRLLRVDHHRSTGLALERVRLGAPLRGCKTASKLILLQDRTAGLSSSDICTGSRLHPLLADIRRHLRRPQGGT